MNKFYSKQSRYFFSIYTFFLFFLTFTNSSYASCGERVVSDSYHCTNFVGERSGNNNYVIFLDNSRTGARDFLRNIDLKWQEFSNGTAHLSGKTKSNINNEIYEVDVTFSGRTTTQPNGSPYGSECYEINASDWEYYTNLSGSIESTSRNFKMVLSRRGAAFQLGQGASTVQNVLGASGWFNTNSNVFDNGDFNIRVGDFVPKDIDITINADDTKVCMGETVGLSSTVSGDVSPCVIRWQRRPQGGTWADWTTGNNVSAAGGFFTAPGVYQFRAIYDCQQANCGTSTSNVVNVEVFADPSISIEADDTKMCLGETIGFRSTLSGGTGACAVQWQRRRQGGTWEDWTTSANPSLRTYFTTPGIYQFRAVYDCNGPSCGTSASNVVNVEVFADPKITIVSDDTKMCLGETIGFRSTLSGGTGACAVQWQRRRQGGTWEDWTTSANPSLRTYFTTPGIYQFRAVYDCNGPSCGTSTSNVVNVEVFADPKITIIADDVEVCLGKTVALSAAVSGGVGSCRTQWQRRPQGGTWADWTTGNNVSAASGFFTAPGVYQFRALYDCDGASCGEATSNIVNVEVVADPNATMTKSNDLTCEKTEATLTAGPSGQSYKWSTGATSRSIKVTNGGTYTVTVTNASGCSKAVSKTVNQSTGAPNATMTKSNDLTCEKTEATLTAGPSGQSYKWNTGATSRSIKVTNGGTYTVTVTNASGCSKAVSKTVNQSTGAPNATMTKSNDLTCEKTEATLTAGPSGQSYKWSTGATSSSIKVTNGGTYTVTVTNASGCSKAVSKTVNQSTGAPNATMTKSNDLTCEKTEATLTAGPSGQSYKWSTGATSRSIKVTNGGTYTVTVTNASGCSKAVSKTVNQSTGAPNATMTKSNDLTCEKTEATLTAGPSGQSYKWSTGATSSSIKVTNGGTYTVTVTNASGCSKAVSKTVNQSTGAPNATMTKSNDLTCEKTEATLTAGPSGQSYKWNTGATSRSIKVTNGGTYTVTVTNASGCSKAVSKTVNQSTGAPNATMTKSNDLTCEKTEATLTAGPSGQSYKWSTGATSSSIKVTNGGTYTVTVTNASGCSKAVSKTVNQSTGAPNASISRSNNISCDKPNATLTANPSGLNYLWSTGATSRNITVSIAGNYQVTVTNSNGCSAVATKAVSGSCVTPVCDNFTFGGKIGFGDICAGSIETCETDGANISIKNCETPTGGSGATEYIWLKNEVSCDGPTGTVAQMLENPNAYDWKIIPNSNSSSYSSNNVTTSTCYLRCARRAGCDRYLGESNIVRIEVNCTTNGDGLTTENCGSASITYGNGSIIMEGGAYYQVFDMNWATIFSCGWQCGNSQSVAGLAEGDYRVIIKNNNWQVMCEKVITLSTDDGGTDDGGTDDGGTDDGGTDDGGTDDGGTDDGGTDDGGTDDGGTDDDGTDDGGTDDDGTIITCDGGTTITYGNGSITMDGGAFYQILDAGWNEVYNCGWECGNTKTVDGLSQGEYRIYIKNSNYQVICEKVITLTNGGTDDGGTDDGGTDDGGTDDGGTDDGGTDDGGTDDGGTDDGGTDDGGTDDGGTDDGGTDDGEILNCGDVTITYGNGIIDMVGETGKSYYFKINDLNNGWAQAFGCGWNCGHQQTATELPNSTYLITISNADWSRHCDIEITMSNSSYTGSAGSRSASQLDFTAFQADRAVELQWLTNSGYKVAHFEVEHSTDGENFAQVNELVNKAWSNELEYHQTIDAQPLAGSNYYRVKEVYLDGSFAYTNVEQVGFNIDLEGLSVFPNPVQENLFISLKPYIGKKGVLTMMNQYGQVVNKLNLATIEEDLVQINTSTLSNGFYFINMTIDNQRTFTEKVLIQRLY